MRLDADGRARAADPAGAAHRREHGSDYSARIEAQVTDASSRQVSGSTIVHATRGTFLLSARTATSVLARRQPGRRHRWTRSTTLARRSRTSRSPFELNRVEYRTGYYNAPTITRVMAARRPDRRRRPRGSGSDAARRAAGSFRVTATATSGGPHDRRSTPTCGCPARDGVADAGGERYLELIADRRSYQPGDTARLVVRGDPVSGPVFLTKEGQHVSWYRVVRQTRERPDRGADRGGRRRRRLREPQLPARRAAVSRRAPARRAGGRAHAAASR